MTDGHPLPHNEGDPMERPGASEVPTALTGAVSARMWLGAPGEGLYYARTLATNRPISPSDREDIKDEMVGMLARMIGQEIAQQTGLEMAPDQIAGRLQVRDCLGGGADIQERCRQYEACEDKDAPEAVRARRRAARERNQDLKALMARMKRRATKAIDNQRTGDS